MRFSIRLNNDWPVASYPELASIAEDAGFDQFWVSHDLFYRSSPVILASVAQATTRIEIGTCIVNPYTVHSSELAMTAATLDELSGGRFNLGIGAGAGEFLKWLGMPQETPLKTTREAILAINAVLSGEPVDRWEPEAYLRFEARRRVPIYLAAFSPNMLRLIGEVADGALPLLFPPEHYDTVAPLVREGAEKAGRSMDQIDFAACVWCSISEDQQAAEDVLKDKIAYYGHALSPLIWDRLGVSQDDFRPIEHALMTERDPVKARSLVDDRMLRIGIAGDPEHVIDRLNVLVERGVKHLSFGPPLGPDPAEAIRTLGEEILPRFR